MSTPGQAYEERDVAILENKRKVHYNLYIKWYIMSSLYTEIITETRNISVCTNKYVSISHLIYSSSDNHCFRISTSNVMAIK